MKKSANNTRYRRVKGFARAMFPLLLVLIPLRASAVELQVGSSVGQAGSQALATVALTDAADLASIEFQLNYDISLLSVIGVTNAPGTLGAAYSLDYECHDGIIVIRLFRKDQLLSGVGQLVSVNFAINAGAKPGMYSDLVVASCGLADHFGADLSWRKSLATRNGALWVVLSASKDSDGDGLSDYEEQMFNGSPDVHPARDTNPYNADSDGDGLSDGYEVAHALNPLNDDGDTDSDGDGQSNRQEMIAGTHPQDPLEFFRVPALALTAGGEAIFHWYSLSGRWYSVHSATNLASPAWETNVYRVPGLGAISSYTNLNQSQAKFFRLLVEPQP